jgi:hypothetical protein
MDQYLNGYDRTIADITSQPVTGVQPLVLPEESTFRQDVEQGIATTLGLFGGTERKNLQQAKKLASVADWLPGTGTGLAAADFADAVETGDKSDMALAGVGVLPVVGKGLQLTAKSAGNLINKTLQNTPTHIPEFYSNPLKGLFNFAKEATSSIVPAIKESISPQGVANRRVLGISDRKVSDWASDVGQDADLTAISISRQLPNTEDTLLERSVVGLKYLDSRIPREDTARLASGIGGGFRTAGEIPDSIVNRALTHLTQGPHIQNPKARYEYQIKDPAAGKNAGYIESVAAAGAGAPVVRAMRGQTTDKYLNVVNNLNKAAGGKPVDKLGGREMIEYLQVASTLDGSAFQLMSKMGAGNQPSVMLETLLRARAKQASGRKLQKGEQKVLSSFDKLLDTKAIKMARVSDEAGNAVGSRNLTDIRDPEGYLVTQQAYTSRQQELGGMNAFVVVDFNKEKMYTMLSDGHDMFGLNPVGGHGLITASPLIESSYKTGSGYNNTQIKKKATPDKIKKALEDTEQTTGVKKLAKETPEAYTKRALLEAKPVVTEADTARAKAAQFKLGTAGTVGVGSGVGVGMLTGGNQEE